jgi:hypothetical protein
MTKKQTLILLHLTLAWLSYDGSALRWNAVATQGHGWYLPQRPAVSVPFGEDMWGRSRLLTHEESRNTQK